MAKKRYSKPVDFGIKPRPTRKKRVLSEEHKAKLRAHLLPGGQNEAIVAARKAREEEFAKTKEEFTTCDIMQFAKFHLKQNFDGFPFQELILRCANGLPLPDGKLKTFVEVPGEGFAVKEVEMTWPEYFAMCSVGASKKYVPGKIPSIVLARIGRRGGKSTAAAVQAAHTGTRKKWRQYVRSSEVITIPIVATSQDQAEKIITQRTHEVLKDADLEWLIGGMDPKVHLNQATNDTIPLITGTEIQAMPCNSKRVRGQAAPLVIFDEYPEFAFEGRKKDKDIRDAACGAMGQFPDCQFWAIGTPGAKEGDFYELEQAARNDPSILALHAPSYTAAPKLYKDNPAYYHNWFNRDPQSFDREIRANYAEAVTPAFREEDIDANMVLPGEVPFDASCRYGAGIDQSGLSGNDRFSLVICGYDPARDVCFEAMRKSWSVSDLDLIMSESRQAMHQYGLYEVVTDRYAKGYVHASLLKEGITGLVSPPTAELCIEFRRLLVANKMHLPMDAAVKEGLMQTQMFYTAKSHTPSVSHPRNSKGHGDEVDARFRAAHQAVAGNWGGSRQTEQEREDEARAQREEREYDPMTHGRY